MFLCYSETLHYTQHAPTVYTHYRTLPFISPLHQVQISPVVCGSFRTLPVELMPTTWTLSFVLCPFNVVFPCQWNEQNPTHNVSHCSPKTLLPFISPPVQWRVQVHRTFLLRTSLKTAWRMRVHISGVVCPYKTLSSLKKVSIIKGTTVMANS